MRVQTLLAESTVKGFDYGVAYGLAAPTKVETDAIGVGPVIRQAADKFRPVIAINGLRHTALVLQSFQHLYDVLGFEAASDLHRQAFSCEQIDHGQGSEASSIGQLIEHKVHTPDLIAPLGGCAHQPMHRTDMTPGPPASRSQAFLVINAIQPTLAHLPTFTLQHHQHPPITESHPSLRNLAHPHPQRRQGISITAIPMARSPPLCCPTGPPFADRVAGGQVPNHLAASNGP